MPSTLSDVTALAAALDALGDVLKDGSHYPEVEVNLARRQFELLERAKVQDRVMAEKIAEGFGYGRSEVRNAG